VNPLPVLNCDHCGVCCRQIGTPPFTGIDGDEPPPWLEWDVNRHCDRLDRRLPCIWYDEPTRRCRHYEHRPQVCREFEIGSPDCLEFRREYGIEGTK